MTIFCRPAKLERSTRVPTRPNFSVDVDVKKRKKKKDEQQTYDFKEAVIPRRKSHSGPISIDSKYVSQEMTHNGGMIPNQQQHYSFPPKPAPQQNLIWTDEVPHQQMQHHMLQQQQHNHQQQQMEDPQTMALRYQQQHQLQMQQQLSNYVMPTSTQPPSNGTNTLPANSFMFNAPLPAPTMDSFIQQQHQQAVEALKQQHERRASIATLQDYQVNPNPQASPVTSRRNSVASVPDLSQLSISRRASVHGDFVVSPNHAAAASMFFAPPVQTNSPQAFPQIQTLRRNSMPATALHQSPLMSSNPSLLNYSFPTSTNGGMDALLQQQQQQQQQSQQMQQEEMLRAQMFYMQQQQQHPQQFNFSPNTPMDNIEHLYAMARRASVDNAFPYMQPHSSLLAAQQQHHGPIPQMQLPQLPQQQQPASETAWNK